MKYKITEISSPFMSWTDSYPVYDEDLVENYLTVENSVNRSEIRALFEVEKIHGHQDKPHIVSCSLFWKPPNLEDESYPNPTRKILQNTAELDYSSETSPWERYVNPFLQQIPRLIEKFPTVSFRIYLANDLEFLVVDLVKVGCEVFLMKQSSIASSPGALWRFLALEEEKLVTVTNISRLNLLPTDIGRTIHIDRLGLGAWKVPVWKDFNDNQEVAYFPFSRCHSGWKGGWPIKELLESFTWNSKRGAVPTDASVATCAPLPITKTRWPDRGFDEWFLAAAMYPRVAQDGILNFVPNTASSVMLTLDVEYSTWANSQSEIIYFQEGGGCC